MFWTKDLLNLLKQPASVLCVIALICGLVLFIPTGFAQPLGVDLFRTQYKQWFGLTLLVTGGLGLLGAGRAFFDWLRKRRMEARTHKDWVGALHSLSANERGLLAYCLANSSSTLLIQVSHPVAQSLCQKGFLQPSAGFAINPLHPHVVPLRTWTFLHENKDAVLSGKTYDDFRPFFEDYEKYLKRFTGE